MSSLRIRPRFKHIIPGDKEALEEKLCRALESEELVFHDHLPGHIYVKIIAAQQHLWSPQLHLTLVQEDDQVIVRGLYGPNPTLWAIFFFSYVIIGIFTLGIGMWGLTRWSLGMDATVLWVVPILWGIGLMMYFASQAGQKMGAQQMFDIHHIYESVTNDKVVVS